jgi:CheY-like chemotaxis protein
MVDEQQQRRINEAAQKYTEALLESYRTATEHAVSAQELNAQLTQQFFDAVMDILQAQLENVRAVSGELGEQSQRGQEAAQALMQESVASYMEFMDTMFPAAGATGRGT